MDIISGINSDASIVRILGNSAVSPTYNLLNASLGLSFPQLYGYAPTLAQISSRGQMLSAAVTFQNRLRPLQTTVASDYASFATQAQSLVDAFNTVQSGIAELNRSSALSGATVSSAANLLSSLDVQATASYANGDSALTRLAQLGIAYQPAMLPGGAASLTLDETALQTAYAADPAGASTLLAGVAGAFSSLAGGFISRSGSQYASLDALLQSSGTYSFLDNSLTPSLQVQNNLLSLLATPAATGRLSWQQVYSAMQEYSMVANLFG